MKENGRRRNRKTVHYSLCSLLYYYVHYYIIYSSIILGIPNQNNEVNGSEFAINAFSFSMKKKSFELVHIEIGIYIEIHSIEENEDLIPLLFWNFEFERISTAGFPIENRNPIQKPNTSAVFPTK